MNLLCVIIVSFSLCIFIACYNSVSWDSPGRDGFVCGHNLVFLLKLLEFSLLIYVSYFGLGFDSSPPPFLLPPSPHQQGVHIWYWIRGLHCTCEGTGPSRKWGG